MVLASPHQPQTRSGLVFPDNPSREIQSYREFHSHREKALDRMCRGLMPGSTVMVLAGGGGGDAIGNIPIALDLLKRGYRVIICGLTLKRPSQTNHGNTQALGMLNINHFSDTTPLDDSRIACRVTSSTKGSVSIPNANGLTSRVDFIPDEAVVAEFFEKQVYGPQAEAWLLDCSLGIRKTRDEVRRLMRTQRIAKVVVSDIGLDMIVKGDEKSKELLRSPVCDLMTLLAVLEIEESLALGTGLGTDGESTTADFISQHNAIARDGGFFTAFAMDPHEDLQKFMLYFLGRTKTETSRVALEEMRKRFIGRATRHEIYETQRLLVQLGLASEFQKSSSISLPGVSNLSIEDLILYERAISLRNGQRRSAVNGLTPFTFVYDPRKIVAASEFGWLRDYEHLTFLDLAVEFYSRGFVTEMQNTN